MPWRKQWIDPEEYEDKEELGRVLSKRAYEVWVSEVSEYIFPVVVFARFGIFRSDRVNAPSRVQGEIADGWL
jgi:hypothetical protein